MPKSRPAAVPEGRAIRAARMGAMTAGIATNMALGGLAQWTKGARPKTRDLLLTPANITRIADELARMRGAAMKMGQLMSMDTGDVLPPELANILGRLRADADFMPPRQLRTVLNEAWGENWHRHFAEFNVRPIAAASIGQVHRARTRDSQTLAIKVQYPGIRRSIESDVTNVGRLIRLSGLMPRTFDLEPYLTEARRQLAEEADYGVEAQHMEAFRAALGTEPGFVMPQIAPEFSTQTVLAMSFIEGVPIEDLQAKDQGTRNRIAERLFRLMLRELFDFGLMQTDPNFANYRYNSDDDTIVLLDFGATRRLGQEALQAVRALSLAALDNDAAALAAASQAMAFTTPDMPQQHVDAIMDMMGVTFSGLLDPKTVDFGSLDLNAQLQSRGQALAEDGFVPGEIPMDLLYIQRKVAGMFLLITRLGAQLPVRAMLEEALGRRDQAARTA
ncbi:MAG: AarF/ABC1/UbiB kinase family protein [Pseudomonadota bacterium]